MSAPLDGDDHGPYTLVVERPAGAPSKLWLIPALFLVISAMIGTFGLVSYAKNANARAEKAEGAVAAARTQLGDQTVELRCRGRASADVAAAEGQLLVAIADALVALGDGTRPREVSVADIATASRVLAEAIRAAASRPERMQGVSVLRIAIAVFLGIVFAYVFFYLFLPALVR